MSPEHPLRIGQILGRLVRDTNGVALGRVHDVRVSRTAASRDAPVGDLRLEALIVGRDSLANRLGFDNAGVTGPWPISTWGRRAARYARLVAWDTVTIGLAELRTSEQAQDLRPAYP